MVNGTSLTDSELAQLGVTRTEGEYGTVYTVPCSICGNPMTTRNFSATKSYKCKMCKNDVKRVRKEAIDAMRREHEQLLADRFGTDQKHMHRFETAAAKFGDEYAKSIETARKAVDEFDSMPEVMACIELLHIGARVITHQPVGDYVVDFCLPDEKVVVEIDGSIYHANVAKEEMRDHAIAYMLGIGWTVRHVPSDDVAKNHRAFGRIMRKMLDGRRDDMGMDRLPRR